MDSNSSAERFTNPNSPFVAETENFCLNSIKSLKSSEPLGQVANTFKFRAISILFGPVACPRRLCSYLSNSLSQCLVSKNISDRH